jgi:hypothetical protein
MTTLTEAIRTFRSLDEMTTSFHHKHTAAARGVRVAAARLPAARQKGAQHQQQQQMEKQRAAKQKAAAARMKMMK